MSESSKEREILMVMRKVLANIIKDTTPEHRSMRHPLSDETIQQIRQCLGLICSRERELADLAASLKASDAAREALAADVRGHTAEKIQPCDQKCANNCVA